MSENTQKLHMICGKIAAGKSTLTAKLAERPGTIVLSEDALLAALFQDQMKSLQDYVTCARRLRAAMGPHIVSLLRAGVSVVLDFQANTVASRAWMRELIDESGAAHCLHVLDVPDEVCLARLRARNASGDHPFQVSEAQFHQVTAHLELPTPDEGFDITRHPYAPDA